MNSKNVLIIAAHPDDEVLGCGATMTKHALSGDQVHVVFMTDGVSSRLNNKTSRSKRELSANEASKILGINKPVFLNYPDNKMDSIDLLDIVNSIESLVIKINPDVIYTHHFGDLNIDHQITNRAVLTACRPQPDSNVKEIYTFEILSSTDYASKLANNFYPNYFVNIESELDLKINAMKMYSEELRDYPHSRSIEAIRSLALIRGVSVGLKFAEAFQIERIIN